MDKNPRLARWIPGFVYRLLSRILRIDFMNDPILYNHPLGGFDGMMIISELSRNFPDLKVLVNDLLTNVKNMDGIFVPINKHGAQAVDNVRRINAIFESDQQVISFPAGLVSRRKKGLIRDVPWQKSIITKAKQSLRDIIPIHVSGRCSSFFHNLANTRKFLGIKAILSP